MRRVDPLANVERSGPAQGAAGSAARLSELAVSTASCTVLLAVVITYRLYCQISGSVPFQAPEVWLYGLAGHLVDPFRGLETVEPARDSGYFELAALVALEVYLILGTAATLLFWLLARALRQTPLASLPFGLPPAARGALRRSLAPISAGLASAAEASDRLVLDALAEVASYDSSPARLAALKLRRRARALAFLMARDADHAANDVAAACRLRLAFAANEWSRAVPELRLLGRSLADTAAYSLDDMGSFLRAAALTGSGATMRLASIGGVSPRTFDGGRRISRRQFLQRVNHV